MVRISIPNLPNRPIRPPSGLSLLSTKEQGAHLGRFLEAGKGRTLVITGAGVSVDSGIRAYRGKEGSYSNPNYKPIFYQELVEDSPRGQLFRKRYWARSFLGYPPVRAAQPNPTHVYLAALQALALAPGLITQNVDNLHRKALARALEALEATGGRGIKTEAETETEARILELHGTLARVHCLEHMHEHTRDTWQAQLAELNPRWDEAATEMEVTGRLPRTNPDGDVELPGADYVSFQVPQCSVCAEQGLTSIVKPNVIFFGETLPPAVKDESFELIDSASQLLILGTTLATYSAFRLVKAAKEQDKPVLMISQGPSRADDTPGVEKMDVRAGPVLRAFLDEYLGSRTGAPFDDIRATLDTGIVKALPDVELPRDDGLIPARSSK